MSSVLGERVLLCRRDLGMNQSELARLSGVSRAHISRMETGYVTSVSTDVLLGLAKVLRTKASYLLGISDDGVGDEDSMVQDNTVVYEVDTPDERRFVESLMAVVKDLSREDRAFILLMAEKLRKR